MLRRILAGAGALLLLLLILLGWLLYQPGAPPPPGAVRDGSLQHGGYRRTYQLFLPEGRSASAGLIFALHPSQSDGAQMRRMIGHVLEPFAASRGLMVVYPDGFEGHFNDCRRAASYSARTHAIDDTGFLRAIVARMQQNQAVDAARVYAVGYSNGAQMGLRLALEAPRFLKGLLMIAANVPARENLDCQTGALSLSAAVLVNGTADPINPYGGGRVTLFGFGDRGQVRSAEESAAWLAGHGLPVGEAVLIAARNGLHALAQDFSGQRAVRLIQVRGGGHLIPQSAYRFMRALGPRLDQDAVMQDALAFLIAEAG